LLDFLTVLKSHKIKWVKGIDSDLENGYNNNMRTVPQKEGDKTYGDN